MTEAAAILATTTAVTAMLHTLIPDHWLPFVLVARSEGWPAGRTAALTALSALLHVAVSLGLGIGAHFLARGAGAAAGIGEFLEQLSAFCLVLFGVSYATWFLVRGGHQHSLGMHPHHVPGQAHAEGRAHPHDLPGTGGGGGHGAAGGRTRRGRSRGLALAAIVGFNPCVLVIPYVHLAGNMGLGTLLLVAGLFALSTISCMVGVVLLGLRGTARLESPFLIRYGEVVSGGLITLTGLIIMVAGH